MRARKLRKLRNLKAHIEAAKIDEHPPAHPARQLSNWPTSAGLSWQSAKPAEQSHLLISKRAAATSLNDDDDDHDDHDDNGKQLS